MRIIIYMYVNLISYTYNTENLFEDGKSFRGRKFVSRHNVAWSCMFLWKKVVIIHFFCLYAPKSIRNFFHNLHVVVLEYSNFSFLIFRADQIFREFLHWDIFELFWNTYFNNFLIFLSIYIDILNWYFIKVQRRWTPIFA